MRESILKALKAGKHRNRDLREVTGLRHDALETELLKMRDEGMVHNPKRGWWYIRVDQVFGRRD